MIRAVTRATLLTCLFSLFAYSHFLVNDYLITPRAVVVLDKMSNELTEKTGINAYVLATTDKLKEGTNLYEYVEPYEHNASKPYVIMIFAPNAVITKNISQTGRLGLIPSSGAIKESYDSREVLHYFNAFIGSKDSNSLQSKYDVAVLQAYSELADQLAERKGVTLKTTFKEKAKWILQTFLWIVRIGAILLIWIYFGRPLYRRIRYGKQ